MPRVYTIQQLAERTAKWAAVGLDYATVQSITGRLETDRSESKARARGRNGTGKMERTVRIIQPRASTVARTGKISSGLTAGSRSKTAGVAYARIQQDGGEIKPHVIEPRRAGVLAFQAKGQKLFRRRVQHPGARIRAKEFLKINESRIAAGLDRDIQKSIDQEIG